VTTRSDLLGRAAVHNSKEFPHRRPQPAAVYMTRHRGSRPGSAPKPCFPFPHYAQTAWAASSPIRSAPRSACCTSAVLRARVLPHGPAHHRRFLPQALWTRDGTGTSIVIRISYLGWTAAQLTALGLAFSTLPDGAISLQNGIILGAVIVLGYTIWGGMWSVAMTDLFQSVMIIVGVVLIAWVVGDMAGGAGKVIAAAAEAGQLRVLAQGGTKEWLAFVTPC
jgi:hypothetical protein